MEIARLLKILRPPVFLIIVVLLAGCNWGHYRGNIRITDNQSGNGSFTYSRIVSTAIMENSDRRKDMISMKIDEKT